MDIETVALKLDSLRLIPRLLIILYGYMAWNVSGWFMALDAPSGAQAAFISTVWGAGAVWFNAYVNSGKK